VTTLFGNNGAKPTGEPESPETHPTALGQLRNAFVVGGGFMGGGTVIFGAFELVRSEPDKAFKLLEVWGPWFILALFSVWAANGLILRVLAALERIGGRFADSMDKVADKQERLADAQDRLADSNERIATATQQAADKDDRERERMSILVEYSGSQSREAVGAVREMQTVLASVQTAVAELSTHVKEAVSSKKDG